MGVSGRSGAVLAGALAASLTFGGCSFNPGPSTAQRAQAGDPKAQYDYAMNEYGGEVLPSTPGAAYTYGPQVAWLLRSAQGGYAPAFCQLALHYRDGSGTAVDKVQAVNWYRRGAVAHDPRCEWELAQLIAAGEGAPRDPVQAYAWLLVAQWDDGRAKKPFIRGSMEPLSQLIQGDLDSLAANLTAAQIAQARQQALSWRPELAQPPVPQ